jgi:hypothetical protein
MKHNQRTPVGKRRKSPSLLERIQPDAALPLGGLACAVRDQDGRDGIDRGLLDSAV